MCEQAKGRFERWEHGTALYSRAELPLAPYSRHLIAAWLLLIKLQHFREGKRFGNEADSEGSFTHSWMIVTVNKLLVDRSCSVRITPIRTWWPSYLSIRDLPFATAIRRCLANRPIPFIFCSLPSCFGLRPRLTRGGQATLASVDVSARLM